MGGSPPSTLIDVLRRENSYYRMATTLATGGALP